MKRSLIPLTVGTAFLAAATVRAETWSARCNGLEFQFDKTSRTAVVFVVTTEGPQFPIAQGPISFDNGVALRGAMKHTGASLVPVESEIGLNKSRNVVYIQSKNPLTGEVTSGKFCEAKIEIK